MLRARPIQVTIWGATGFTGRLVASYLSKRLPVAAPSAKWAIAGRDPSKLERVRDEVVRGGCSSVPEIVVGSSADQPSIDTIVRQSQLIISCAGPFCLHGDQVVDACVR
jgi:short subunit dehydrogenase-like uncharacterized protein